MGFKNRINFVVSPVLNDLYISQLEQIKSKIIFSGAPPLNSKKKEVAYMNLQLIEKNII